MGQQSTTETTLHVLIEQPSAHTVQVARQHPLAGEVKSTESPISVQDSVWGSHTQSTKTERRKESIFSKTNITKKKILWYNATGTTGLG